MDIITNEDGRIILYEGIILPLTTARPNRPRTTSLFPQTDKYDTNTPHVFSLNAAVTVQGRVLPPLKPLYMAIGDVTEYEFAITVFDSWDWFCKLMDSKAGVYIQKWRSELQMKIRSEAVSSLIKTAQSERGTTAAKYIAEHGWDKAKRVKENDTKLTDEFQDDAERIGLTLIKSTKQ